MAEGAISSPLIAADAAPTVSVVMVSFHTGPALFEAVAAVLGQAGLAELVLVDNGNPPDTVAALRRLAAENARLVVLTGHGNIGFAAGCNLGCRAARGMLLLLLNPDCVPPPGTLEKLRTEAVRLPRPFMLGCRLVNVDGSDQRGARRNLLTPANALSEALGLPHLPWLGARLPRLNRHAEALPVATAPIPAISGACMMLPLADYWAAGGMDEGYFLHVEDLDFCLAFRRQGGEIYFVPSVAIPHRLGTSRESPIRVEWLKTKGFLRYFAKNFAAGPPWLPALAKAAALARFAARAILALAAGRR